MTPARPARPAGAQARPLPIDPRRGLGCLGEELALAHLGRLGFEPVARNQRTAAGEIDLIVFDGLTLAFVEVKTRRVGSHRRRGPDASSPLTGLRAGQRARVRRAAALWLAQTPQRPRARSLRLDAVGVIVDADGQLVTLEHVEGAM